MGDRLFKMRLGSPLPFYAEYLEACHLNAKSLWNCMNISGHIDLNKIHIFCVRGAFTSFLKNSNARE